MPNIKFLIGAAVAGLATFAAALPAQPKLSQSAVSHYDLARRQNAAAAAAGITDIDILQLFVLLSERSLSILMSASALTLEFLETTFYQQGFAMFPDSDFLALGLTATDLTNLKSIGRTEQTHVTTLLTAIAASGTRPVAPCTYNFGFKTAAEMVAIAAILENVGVSA
jgi:hypothetical protein